MLEVFFKVFKTSNFVISGETNRLTISFLIYFYFCRLAPYKEAVIYPVVELGKTRAFVSGKHVP